MLLLVLALCPADEIAGLAAMAGAGDMAEVEEE